MVHLCHLCEEEFPSSTKLYNHTHDVHVNTLQVTINKKTSIVERIDGKFSCPDCPSTLTTSRSFKDHLNKKHMGTCSTLSKAEKRRDIETDNDDNGSSVLMKHHKPSIGEKKFSADRLVTFQTSNQFDDDSAILLACNALSCSPRVQESCVFAAKIGKLEPVLLTSSNGKIYPFLAASENIIDVLSDNPTGSWSLPTVNKIATTDGSLSTDTDDLFKCIVRTSPIYKHIADQQYIELTKEITQELNKDWYLFPQLRFASSHIFTGSILLSGSTALLVNCVESYGRSKVVDSHHERRTASTTHQSSFPKTQSKYGEIVVCQTLDDNTTKLKIGASSFNLLVTSSVRLDKQTITNATVETGPNTSNFVPLPATKIYLNAEHLKTGKVMFQDDTITCIGQSYIFFQLRQLRSKFYCLSTYSLCRAFSSIISDISYRPYTIWTLCEYDSSQSLDSQSQKLSRMFQSIASEVFKNGSAARIEVMLFHKLHNTLKEGKVKDTVEEIISLQENGLVPVIDNLNLSRLLQDLADSMTTSIRNANQTAIKLLSQHLYN